MAITAAFLLFSGGLITRTEEGCSKAALTTVSGISALAGEFCPNDLIFEDNFDNLNANTWQREATFWGGGVSRIIVKM